ncbi:CHASE3 domain-containing protein [Chitinimonas koreensis]|uniref:CHASE3 domain-containing protein n=1 Tax=Chitinimonas koreensis TaxID=356302 RepID=UPI00041655D2|nr:CHASE3 domain-containing protein [Chitinimonas koreensis]QNM95631.1 CHASE3 domain-containing protein [Chitinimonas koreensis]
MAPFKRNLNFAAFVALGVCLSCFFLIMSELAHRRLGAAGNQLALSIEARGLLRETLSIVHEVEAGQRGFLLTEQPDYLASYRDAQARIQRQIERLRVIWAASPERRSQLVRLNNLVGQRIGEFDAVLALYSKQGLEAARALVRSDLGRRTSEEIAAVVDGAIAGEARHYERFVRGSRTDINLARAGTAILAAVNLILLLLLYHRSQRELEAGAQRARNAEARRQELERIVAERTAVLSALSTDLQLQQEREKAHIARDIHDELGSAVISARMDVTYVLGKLRESDQALAEKLERAIQSLDASVDIKRRLIEELRPSVLDTLGLAAALEWQVQQVCERTGLTAQLDLDEAIADMPEPVAIALYRITQEALTNVVKYAKASRLTVTLRGEDDGWRLLIRDDGIGLSPGAELNPLSHGIAGMRQRVVGTGGRFSIEGTPGGGTTIEVRVPRPAAGQPSGG